MKTYVIPGAFPGRLAIAARPRGGDWLADDLSRLVRDKWNVLVSALQRTEEIELGLLDESSVAQRRGLQYVSFPIDDRAVPDVERVLPLIGSLKTLLTNGSNVAVHCRMGIGRSSLLCGSVMVACGSSTEIAWSTLTSARGLAVPDTIEQKRWLAEFERVWRGRSA